MILSERSVGMISQLDEGTELGSGYTETCMMMVKFMMQSGVLFTYVYLYVSDRLNTVQYEYRHTHTHTNCHALPLRNNLNSPLF